jgi:hypothetical protein
MEYIVAREDFERLAELKGAAEWARANGLLKDKESYETAYHRLYRKILERPFWSNPWSIYMKKIYLMHLDQNQVIHLPLVCFDATFEDLCGIEKDFKKSKGLKDCFDNPEVKEILITIYIEKGQETKRRRIAGIKEELTTDRLKSLCDKVAADLEISLTWHTNAEFQKILPMKKSDRDLLKLMIGTGKSKPVL